MTALDRLIQPERDPDGALWLEVAEGWQQGRGAFGGYVIAALVRSMELAHGDETRTLRAVSATLGGPALVGRSRVQTEVLRAGSGLTTVAARLVQSDGVCAHGTGVFAKDRAIDHSGWQRVLSPTRPDFREVATVPVGPPLGPVFAQHFEFRPIDGLPFSGAEPATSGWVRAKDPGRTRDAAYLVALADAWWPCALVCESGPRPMATIAFSLEVLGDFEGLDPDAPVYYRARSEFARGGFALETRELWGYDGRPLAINHQTFAVIR